MQSTLYSKELTGHCTVMTNSNYCNHTINITKYDEKENSPAISRIVTVTRGVKINTFLVPSRKRKYSSGPSVISSMMILNVAVTVATLVGITNSFVVLLTTVLTVFAGFVT